MKTLDEVIKALELCSTDDNPCDKCPYTAFDKKGVWACSMCGDFAEDALHYLKEYREEIDNIRTFHDDHIAMKNELAEIKNADNDYLTWDELRQMEGKPVWVEWTGSPRWGIVDGIYKDAFGAENLVVCVPHDYLHFDKRMQGDVWQAYRKERHETGD